MHTHTHTHTHTLRLSEKNTGHLLKSEFQINTQHSFSITVSQALHGTYLN